MKDLFGFTKLFETEKLLLFGCFPRYANMLPKFGNPQSQKYAEFFISEIGKQCNYNRNLYARKEFV